VPVEPPDAGPEARAVCERLAARLPDRLDDDARRSTEPDSPMTAAWGERALVLRCGVPPPPGLLPTSDVIVVEDVSWFLVEAGSGYAFTTVGRTVGVELTVPSTVDRSEATAPLVDLAPAIKRAVPEAASAQTGGAG
jgi:hypothetical protein